MTPATEIMLAAAEKWARENGERHGYSMTVQGAAEVLRQNGFETDGRELSNLFHDPLSDFHNEFPKGTVTFEKLAEAMNSPRGFRPGTVPNMNHPFDQIERSRRFPYPLDSPVSPQVRIDWIANEWSSFLKKEKIRKGTKRFKEKVEENRKKVIGAATESAQKAEAEARKKYEKNIKELDRLHDEAIESRERAARAHAIRRAFADTAGVDNPSLREYEDLETERWNKVIEAIEEQASYMESDLADFDPEKAGRDALRVFEETRPFVE